MERPFVFIEYKTTTRDEFIVKAGRQPTYAFFFLKKGSFKLLLDNNEQIVKEGDCVIFSDDIDFFRTVIDPISFIYLKFTINPRCPISIDIPCGIIKFKNKDRFLDSMEKYEKLAEAQMPSSIYYREHLLEDILLQAFAEHNCNDTTDVHADTIDYKIRNCHDETANSVTSYIISHISEKLTVDTLCQVAKTNASTLNFKIKKAFSMPSGAWVEYLRMREARKLLRNTTFKISEIATRCGYENIYYFSNVFSKHHGLSPTEYRSKYR